MYHDIRKEVQGKQVYTCVKPEQFEQDMRFIRSSFQIISLRELKSYANQEIDLPKNPIIITFDDGYYSFYEHAFPVLRAFGIKATVSLIGSQIGGSTYKDTGVDLVPRFGYEEANVMFSSGLVDFQSHSYDMHDNMDIEQDGRVGCLIKEGESEEDYEKKLADDYKSVKSEIERNIGGEVFAHFYPFGAGDELSERSLKNAGCEMTLLGNHEKCNEIKREPSGLYGLTRFNVTKAINQRTMWRLLR